MVPSLVMFTSPVKPQCVYSCKNLLNIYMDNSICDFIRELPAELKEKIYGYHIWTRTSPIKNVLSELLDSRQYQREVQESFLVNSADYNINLPEKEFDYQVSNYGRNGFCKRTSLLYELMGELIVSHIIRTVYM